MTDVELPEPHWDSGPVDGESWADAVPMGVGSGPVIHVPTSEPPAQPRENHIYTVSLQLGRHMICVRADSTAELNRCWAALERDGVLMQLSAAYQAWEAAMPPAEYIKQKMGATQVSPAAPPGPPNMAQQYPTPANGFAGPPVPSPGPAPFGAGPGPAAPWGAAPQPSFAPGFPPAPAPAGGLLRVKIPFTDKAEGDGLKAWLKQTGQYEGNVRWEAASKSWLISPAVAQHFAKWNPVPA